MMEEISNVLLEKKIFKQQSDWDEGGSHLVGWLGKHSREGRARQML